MPTLNQINLTLNKAIAKTPTRYPEYREEATAEIFCLMLLDTMFAKRIPIDEIITTQTQELQRRADKSELREYFIDWRSTVLHEKWMPMMRHLKRQNDLMQRIIQAKKDCPHEYYPSSAFNLMKV